MRNTLLITLLCFLFFACSNKSPNPQKKVVANSYSRKCSVFENIPQADSSKREIVFLGHSLINEFLVNEYMPHGDTVVYTNMGIGGDDVRGMYNRRQQVFDRSPSTIVVEIGINDLINDESMDTIIYYYEKFLSDTKQLNIDVIICAVIPGWKELNDKIVYINSFLQEQAQKHNYKYLDIYTPMENDGMLNSMFDCGDHIHLTGSGYSLWADSLMLYLL